MQQKKKHFLGEHFFVYFDVLHFMVKAVKNSESPVDATPQPM
jgi:hypothetical protein